MDGEEEEQSFAAILLQYFSISSSLFSRSVSEMSCSSSSGDAADRTTICSDRKRFQSLVDQLSRATRWMEAEIIRGAAELACGTMKSTPKSKLINT